MILQVESPLPEQVGKRVLWSTIFPYQVTNYYQFLPQSYTYIQLRNSLWLYRLCPLSLFTALDKGRPWHAFLISVLVSDQGWTFSLSRLPSSASKLRCSSHSNIQPNYLSRHLSDIYLHSPPFPLNLRPIIPIMFLLVIAMRIQIIHQTCFKIFS